MKELRNAIERLIFLSVQRRFPRRCNINTVDRVSGGGSRVERMRNENEQEGRMRATERKNGVEEKKQ